MSKQNPKILLLNILLLGCSLTILPNIIGCSNNVEEAKYTEEVYNQAIKEFIGKKGSDGVYRGGICQYPHNSFNLDEIRDYLTSEINNVGYKVEKDDYGNIWFDVPSTVGFENTKPLILQAHMDMVWSVDSNNPPASNHPVPVIDQIDGKEVIHTLNYQSSLGADDGAGLALILAIAKNKNISHGPLRCLITADEEPGLVGACSLDPQVISHDKGFDYLLNIDSETIGEMSLGMAGGYSCKFETNTFNYDTPGVWYQYVLEIDNGLGGHSGLAMREGHMNAIKTLNDSLLEIVNNKNLNLHLNSIDSYQNAANVIPGKATFIFQLEEKLENEDKDDITSNIMQTINRDYPVETQATCVLNDDISPAQYLLDKDTSISIMNLIKNCAFGASKWKQDQIDLVSSSNLCPVQLDLTKQSNQFFAQIYSRSDYENDLNDYKALVLNNFNQYKEVINNASLNQVADYPPFVKLDDDKIFNEIEKLYKLENIPCTYVSPHAGAEVSCFAKINEYLNQTMVGPNITGAHTPSETLDLISYKQITNIVLKMLNSMKNI